MRGRAVLLAGGFALAGCVSNGSQLAPAAHYVVGGPYRAGGVWRYPRELYDYQATGLAAVSARPHRLTADGERYDPQALAAAHPTLQLPCVLRVTALDSGRQIVVRVNDRGPTDPGRLVALTPRAFALLGGHGAAPLRVAVTVDEVLSRQLAASVGGETVPHLAIAAAPEGDVKQEALAAPGDPRPAPPVPVIKPKETALPPAATPPALPTTVVQVAPRPGALAVEAGRFTSVRYAAVMQDALRAYGATIGSDPADRDQPYRVTIGPLASVAQADDMLRRVLAAGYPDARIVAE